MAVTAEPARRSPQTAPAPPSGPARSKPSDGDDWARPGERCSCGRQAVIVYITTRWGRVGYCGIPGAKPLPAQPAPSAEPAEPTRSRRRPAAAPPPGGAQVSADQPDDAAQPTSPAPPTPLSARQQALTAGLRCHYAQHPTNPQRPRCQETAVVAYGPIALCASCDQMRSAVGRTHAPRRLPGAQLAALIDAARAQAQAETDVAAAVGLARAAGASWGHIGDAVGVSRQAAQQRWRNVAGPASGSQAGLTPPTSPSPRR